MQVDDNSDGEGSEDGGPIVVENPSIVSTHNVHSHTLSTGYDIRWGTDFLANFLQDLEVYISNYKGMAKLQRLMFIADHCPSLQQEALKMALSHVHTTYNTQMYQNVHKKLVDSITRYEQWVFTLFTN